MADDTRLARAAEQDNPGCNPNFRRRWAGDLVTGPDVPSAPAHGTAWHPEVLPRRLEALRRERASWRAAEAAWRRLTDGQQSRPGNAG